MNREVERYLRRATRGLWGQKKREVEEELMAHISGRLNAHLIAGLDEIVALQKTLEELGSPEEVNSGMTTLYLTPKLLSSSTLIMAFTLLAYVAITSGAAQTLGVKYRLPSTLCLGLKEHNVPDRCSPAKGRIQIKALQDALFPHGVKVAESNSALTLEFPEAQALDIPLDRVASLDDADRPLPSDQHSRRDYVGVWDVIRALMSQTEMPVMLEGWNDPMLRIGDVHLRLDSREQVVDAEVLYFPYLSHIASHDFNTDGSTASYLFGFGEGRSLTTKTALAPGIYGLIARLNTVQTLSAETIFIASGSSAEKYSHYLSVAEADSEGYLTFAYPGETLRFAETLSGNAINTAVLVRLTGEVKLDGFGYEVVSPEQIRLE